MHHEVGHVMCIWGPHFERRGGCRESATVPFKRALVVFYL